jgi:GDPmannose 4,6-dehydratase
VGDVIVKINPRYFRPAEVETLLGDPTKARNKLGWTPEVTAEQMCHEMVMADLAAAQKIRLLMDHGHEVPITSEK